MALYTFGIRKKSEENELLAAGKKLVFLFASFFQAPEFLLGFATPMRTGLWPRTRNFQQLIELPRPWVHWDWEDGAHMERLSWRYQPMGSRYWRPPIKWASRLSCGSIVRRWCSAMKSTLLLALLSLAAVHRSAGQWEPNTVSGRAAIVHLFEWKWNGEEIKYIHFKNIFYASSTNTSWNQT